MRVKKFVPNKKGDIGMEVYYLCQPNTMSLLVNLVSSSDGNDIGVGLTYVGSIPPFLCPFFYLEQIFLPSLVCILFLTVICSYL